MNIAILGYGDQGRAAYEYWDIPGNQLTVCDMNPDVRLPRGAKAQLGQAYLKDLDRFDLLVRSPGIHPRNILAGNSPVILDKVTTVTNEFIRVCPSRKIIGVTGTKGKGTTSTLIARMLEATGERVHLGGNIGIPPLDMLKNNIQPDDWVVLELASFQLIDLKYSPPIAVCLMVAPEHLNWHEDMDEYVTAKQQLFRWQAPEDIAIYYSRNDYSKKVASVSPGQLIPYYQPPGAAVVDNQIVIEDEVICDVTDIQLLGKHNWQNVCAAVTAVWYALMHEPIPQATQNIEALQTAIHAFQGMPHRLEYVREVEGVRYFNDSFASAPEAAMAALEAITQPKVMIMGGFDRGLDLSGLAGSLHAHHKEIRKALLVGASAARLAEVLAAHDFHNYEVLTDVQMPDIVLRAQAVAQNGDAVVLSPGFPSFDMFKNFEERGMQYKETVNAL